MSIEVFLDVLLIHHNNVETHDSPRQDRLLDTDIAQTCLELSWMECDSIQKVQQRQPTVCLPRMMHQRGKRQELTFVLAFVVGAVPLVVF